MGLDELHRMPPKARAKYLEIIRAIPLGRKIEIAAEFCDTVREFVMGVIRSEHPNASDDEIRREFSRRVLPEDIRTRAHNR